MYTIRDVLNKFNLKSDLDDKFLDCVPDLQPDYDTIKEYRIEKRYGEKMFIFSGMIENNPKYAYELRLAENKSNREYPATWDYIDLEEGYNPEIVYRLRYSGDIITEFN